MWLTPVVYPTSLVPAAWRTLYALNPMVTVLDGFRWALLGSEGPGVARVVVTFVGVGALLVSGLLYFRRTEQTFADVI
jgi:lipopolysaccharide transport system permease protein